MAFVKHTRSHFYIFYIYEKIHINEKLCVYSVKDIDLRQFFHPRLLNLSTY